MLPTSLQFSDISVAAQRIPVQMTLALRPTTGRWQLIGEVGLALDIWRFQGRAPEAHEQWRAMLGGGARVSCRHIGWGPVGPEVSLFASGFPKTHRFVAAPSGEVGTTNHLWIGASAGVVWDFSVTAAAR